jgi:hypothetical protein
LTLADGGKISDVYDDTFFDGIDGVTNALDNVQARKLTLSFPL